MDFFEVFQAQEARAASKETQRENAPRLAFSAHQQRSKGLGSFRIPAAVKFDVVFLTEPHFLNGGSLVTTLPADVDPPMISSVVWRWERNAKTHYTGAFMHLFVNAPDVFSFDSNLEKVEVVHNFTFIGVGYKDLGSRVSNEAQMLVTRPVGFGGV